MKPHIGLGGIQVYLNDQDFSFMTTEISNGLMNS